MKKSKELIEERAGLLVELKALKPKGDEKLDMVKFDKINDRITELHGEVRAANAFEKIALDELKKPEQKQEREFNSKKDVGEAYRQLFLGGGNIQNVDANIRANIQSTTDALGGYTIPEGFSGMLTEAELFYSDIPSVASTMTTATGNDMPWPTTNDSGNVAYQVGEAGDLTTSAAAAAIGSTTFKAYKWHTGMVKINYELFQDSFWDMEKVLASLFAERKGRGENAAFTTGAGTSTIEGIVTGAANASLSGVSATALTRDNILDLIHSVDRAYRKNPSFRIMFSDATMAAIRKLDYGTSDARPLYQPSAIVGEPGFVEGVKILINNDMADIGASAKSIVVGDMSQYKIRRVNGLRLAIARELYLGTDQIGMDLLWRVDAQVLNAGTNPIKYLVHAAS